MEFRFKVHADGDVPPPASLYCSNRLADHLRDVIDESEGVRMISGTKLDVESFEFIWEMGFNSDPESFASPEWILECGPTDPDSEVESIDKTESVVADAGAPSTPSIIAAVGRTVTGEENPPF